MNKKAREKATDQVCRCFCTSLPSSLLLKFHTSYPPSPPARPVCMHYFDFYDLFSQKIISLNVKGIVFDASAVISFKGFIFPLSTLVFCQEDTFRGRGYGVMGCGESQMCTFRETPTHPNKAREEKDIVF